MSQRLRLRAHAKVNLALRVGTAGEDGFHPLATVFQTVSLCDLLYARRAAPASAAGTASVPLRLRVEGAELPDDDTVTHAVGLLAGAMRAHGVEPAPLEMRLVKRVPQGAGLGGGSSDAAAALAACARLWRPQRDLLEDGVLQDVAARVGSDVPFFLYGGTALGTGRGTRIEPLDELPGTWFVLAAPRVQVPTARAYAAFDRLAAIAEAEGGATAPVTAAPPVPDYVPRLDEAWMGNDLAAPVQALWPEVEQARRRLLELGARVAQMSGSGAASFGAFAGRRDASRAARRLRDEGLWARACTSVTAAQHRRGIFYPV